ncbi:MAG: nucleoside triphosphate pyrophosphohydrolase [Candidatus Sungbacteria bacterium]|uniref:Nucleoside triphosphate pyrophosphohydrolase n=1 Tax=Candidatus Sungiibacteriota bacterium TaxID=2750080 RepID=A0A932YYI6_9BACT|nr:nucleoside triphosphate pyrophosphohydrolase [Candidatus Sungbacteria bacterium]
MKTFRKLIHDKIPEIIAAKGEHARVRVLAGTEFLPALENKLLEEVQEMRLGAEKKTEIADIYEVLDALIAAYGFSKEEIIAIQARKREERGGFEKRLFLEEAE